MKEKSLKIVFIDAPFWIIKGSSHPVYSTTVAIVGEVRRIIHCD